MNTIIRDVKNLVKKECEKGKVADWYFDDHLCQVEKFSLWLAKDKKVDKEALLLAVWLHDIAYVKGMGRHDHDTIGAQESEKILKKFDVDKKTIGKVKQIILCHRCKKIMPQTLEEKILATADAMTHFHPDFYFHCAWDRTPAIVKTFTNYKKWMREKIERDYSGKLFFPKAKKKIEPIYRALKTILAS